MSETTVTPEVPENGPIDNRYLSDQFMEMVFFIERHHASNGVAPNDDTMMKRFEIEPKSLEDFKVNTLVQKSLRYRGIVYPALRDRLTDRQMAAIAVMLNYADRRSDEKKLRDIGITTREWTSWLLDDNFAAYLSDRSERLLVASQHEAHLGLIKGIRGGNLASVKLYNEMTGRYNPEAENNFNIKVLLGTFIEILQKHVSDPIVLHRIALEMNNAAARQSLGDSGAGPSGRFAPAQKSIAVAGEVI